jgi:hypothetical protein
MSGAGLDAIDALLSAACATGEHRHPMDELTLDLDVQPGLDQGCWQDVLAGNQIEHALNRHAIAGVILERGTQRGSERITWRLRDNKGIVDAIGNRRLDARPTIGT